MYKQISANNRRSYILIAFFLLFVLFIGYVFGMLTGTWYLGLFIAALISILMILVSYYSGDKIILNANNAKLVHKKDYPYLYNTVEGLAIAAGIPKTKLYIIDSDAMNAFATGRNPKEASVAVTKGLVEKLNRAELEGVIAHEMSHIKNYDIMFMLFVVVLASIIVLLSDMLLRSFVFRGGNNEKSSFSVVFLIVGLVLALLSPIIAQLVKLAISRKREFLADADGALLTRYPKGLAEALRKISKDSNELKTANKASANIYFSNPFRKGYFSGLFSTHPPLEARIKALEAM